MSANSSADAGHLSAMRCNSASAHTADSATFILRARSRRHACRAPSAVPGTTPAAMVRSSAGIAARVVSPSGRPSTNGESVALRPLRRAAQVMRRRSAARVIATYPRRTSSAFCGGVFADECGRRPFSAPAITTVCHSRPFAAWNVSTSTPSSPEGRAAVVLNHDMNMLPLAPPAGFAARNSSTSSARSCSGESFSEAMRSSSDQSASAYLLVSAAISWRSGATTADAADAETGIPARSNAAATRSRCARVRTSTAMSAQRRTPRRDVVTRAAMPSASSASSA